MPRPKQTAADYIERYDPEMRIILGDLVEYAGKITNWWTDARLWAREDPGQAMTSLVHAETHLSIHVRIELQDTLRRIRAAIDLLDAELPDDEGDEPRKHSQKSGDIRGH